MTILVVGGVVVVVSVVLLALMFMKSNQVKLTEKTNEKPEWMKSNPPGESVKAAQTAGNGFGLYGKIDGEHEASAFVEQIEDILHSKMEKNPALNSFKVDFGTGQDGSLEIWVNGEKFDSVDAITDETLKQALKESIREWDGKK